MLYFRNMETSSMGRMLKDELTKAGMRFVNPTDGRGLRTEDYKAVISYGVPLPDGLTKPTLNSGAGGISKLEELKRLKAANVPCIPFAEAGEVSSLTFPILRRKFFHKKGKDIVVIKNAQSLRRWLRADRFYTQVVPSKTEYRVWVFRDKVLATYEKVLTKPDQNTKFGRNHQNGFAFKFRPYEDVEQKLRDVAKASVKARGLDFGAVDILGTENYPEKYVTLEVNSAPGVEEPTRACVQNLVKAIIEWERNGFPERT